MGYLLTGFSLLCKKGLKRFVVMPLLINLVLFSVAFIWLWQLMQQLISATQSMLPSWLAWLEYLLIPLGIMSVLISFAYSFTLIANIIAAPFNGLLSEKTEALLSGRTPAEISIQGFIQTIPAAISREWQKLWYILPRVVFLFILCWFIPVIGPLLWFACSAWFYTLQYLDYPFDNNQVSFAQLRSELKKAPALTLSFGSAVAICSMLPFLNLLVMPAAVCGATALWCGRFADHYDPALQAAGARSYRKLDKYC